MKLFRSFLLLATLAVGAIATPAMAHSGGEPKRGGVVSTASDLAFELVPGADGATLYIEDHGKPVPTASLAGKLVVLQGADKSEADLVPTGENAMLAKGLKFDRGAKAIATIEARGKKPV